MTCREVGIGIVGLGDQGPRYARLIIEHPAARLRAVCSRSAARAQEIAAVCGGHRAYTDFGDMLGDSDIEGVIVSSEVDRHVELTAAALRAGKHVLVEKPLTALPDPLETDMVLALAQKAGRILMLAWVERYDPRCALLQRRISSGELGKIVSVFVRRNGQRWAFGKPRFQKHPWIWEPGVHSIDLALWLAGEAVVEVYVCGGMVADTGYLDTFWVTMRFASGAVGVIEQVSNTMPESAAPTGDREVEVIGTKGTIRWREPNDGLVQWTAAGSEILDAQWHTEVSGVHVGALRNLVADFVRHVHTGEQPAWGTPAEVLQVAVVGRAIMESLLTNRIVRIDGSASARGERTERTGTAKA